MLIRKSLLFIPLVASFLATSCTTRYQDMLRDRDAQIRELSNDVARLRASNEDLERQRGTSQPANAVAPKADSSPNLINELQNEVGTDAKVGIIRGQISIGVEDSVTFDSGSTTLKDTSHKVLKNIASALKNKFSGRRIYVSGHTDSDPIEKTKALYSSNRDLSARRADSVARYLIQQGVPESAIVIVGFGQFDPRDPKQKARNRRVEIAVGEQL